MTPFGVWVLTVTFLGIITGSRAGEKDSGLVSIPRCRAKCLSRFLKKTNEITHEACQDNKRCQTCWNYCSGLFVNFEVWGQVCQMKTLCPAGCQMACQFKKRMPVAVTTNNGWHSMDPPAIAPDLTRKTVHIAWAAPSTGTGVVGGTDQAGSSPSLVYVLFAREKTRTITRLWKETLQTASTKAQLDMTSLPYDPEFWLLAVSEQGIVAQMKFNSTFAEAKPWEKDSIPVTELGSRWTDAMVVYDWSSGLNVTMNLTVVKGTIRPVLRWKNPAIVLPPGRKFWYQVHYFLNFCECDLPPDHFSQQISVAVDKEAEVVLTSGIVFGAEYDVQINLESHSTFKGSLKFTTPDCPHSLSYDYTECRAELDLPEIKTLMETTTTTTTPAWEHIGNSSDETRVIKPGLDMPQEPQIEWNITVTGKTYDPVSHFVLVDVAWELPLNLNRTLMTQKIHCYHFNESSASLTLDIDQTVVDKQATTLKLKPNRAYKVTVIVIYSDGTRPIELRSLATFINTDRVASLPQLQPSNLATKSQEKEILNGIILGVTVVASIIIFGIIVLFIYKKRQSFRDIIITKTAVAKSNSYKSNVGCKVDYSNQMLMSSDDWELDCRQLKFSSPIGQGAFGKVVTGYYQDDKVAIKLVRDCAPLSYKEDLLAEIDLMKRLGSHPNIVLMIGACTLAEPIALVMEYIPYGNLQNFLKKCRLEGELTIQAGKCQELNYSIMDDHGGVNEGVVTPADMLSFARQVSMAMEYLAEKKYVHRDLAARNVLLGYDKVIKVCDFGLSRDIYNDNQYKKLTNGKLPLKWMAIESLRDRVFTTQSDVWSFGILLWEIVTMGASPYPNIALADLYYVLSNNYRMEKPSNCSDELYIIMRQCWLENPKDRPTFTDLRVHLEMLLTRDRNYLELDNINVPLSTPESSSGSPVSDDTASLLAAQALQTTRKSSKDELTVNVCVHEKSVDRLLKRKGDFDSHNITIL